MHDMDNKCRNQLAQPNRTMAPVQWYGGKGQLARRIIPHIPPGRVYVEPYCGAASVLWHLKPRSVEVLNDIDRRIVTLFRVLQDAEQYEELAHRLTWTLYSLDEFRRALQIIEQWNRQDVVTRAWAVFTSLNQGFAGQANTAGDWGRVFVSSRGMAGTANDWRGHLATLPWWHERLTRVQIDSRDALEVIRYWDSPDTVFYLDPPYVHDTRVKGETAIYAEEPDDAHHAALVDILLGIEGQAVVSGYAQPIYAPLVDAGWERRDMKTACHAVGKLRGSKIRGNGAGMEHVPRTETLWIKRNGGQMRMMW